MKVTMYTDGSARGNPDGPGGYGTIIEYIDTKGNKHIKELSCGYIKTTNNRMELMGVIKGLEALTKICEVDLYSDSQYVIKAFNEGWINNWIKKGWKKSDNKPVLNKDLWVKLIALVNKHQVTFHWVKGHNGNPNNERCDDLAVSAALSNNLIEDIVE